VQSICYASSAILPAKNLPVTELPAQKSEFVQALFSAIAKRYDLANHLLSGGLDFLWRRRAARLVQSWQATRILDLATGSGDLAITLRQFNAHALIVGADFCPPMLREAQRKGVTHLVAADGMRLPFADATFDAVTIAFGLRNMESWPKALAEIGRVLRTHGHVLVLDFSMPSAPIRWLYRPYLHHVLPRVAALLTGEKAAYDYLGRSIEAFPHGTAMCALLSQAGFDEAAAEALSGGIVSLYAARRNRLN
jgi:demethylmenaquinone methyltransferase/2-methoxy-6-polyprenyl-1,4-benzoquinol methylase